MFARLAFGASRANQPPCFARSERRCMDGCDEELDRAVVECARRGAVKRNAGRAFSMLHTRLGVRPCFYFFAPALAAASSALRCAMSWSMGNPSPVRISSCLPLASSTWPRRRPGRGRWGHNRWRSGRSQTPRARNRWWRPSPPRTPRARGRARRRISPGCPYDPPPRGQTRPARRDA